MRFGVLGPVAVWTDDGVPVTVPGAKVRALLADLLVHRGAVVTADQLVVDLWEDAPPSKPSGALQAKVSQLRRALEEAEPGGRDLVVSRGPGYVLDVAADAVDAGRFAALVASPGRDAVAGLAAALELWRGPALADVADAAFARAAVTVLTEQRLVATEAHLDARAGHGDAAAIAELATLAARHPLRERLHAKLIRALYRAGRQAEALRRYDELRATLADELGVDPSPELAALHGALLRQEIDGQRREAPPSNLPAAWDETVGRDEDVAALRAALGTARLVTVVGPGGVGKTRLALEAARGLHDGGDEVRFVDLARVDGADAGAVADAVADALGLREDDGPGDPGGPGVPHHPGSPDAADRADRVVAALARRHLLLVLDNCEHVVDAAADVVARILRHAPDVRVLATGREPLGLRGEHLRPVAPLGLPDADGDPSGAPAVRLFVARVAAADPTFALTPATAPAVVAVCRRLDGLPLALELAAARVRTLGLREVAARLDDRFALLDSGPRDMPARQRTLRGLLDWSWEPLSAAERAVLRRLAAAAGDGAGAGLVEPMCGGDPVPEGRVPELLARLVDRSLVLATDHDAGRCWRMLETVGAYAADRLAESGEDTAVRLRHAQACADLVESAAPGLSGHDQARWLDRLDGESGNVRIALDTAVAAGDAALALRIVVAASWFWYLRGRSGTARRSLVRALALPGGPAVLRAAAEAAHAAVVIRERAVDDPIALARTALAAYDDLDEPLALARARWAVVEALGRIGDLSVSEEIAAGALRTFRAVGDRWGVAAVRAEQGFNDVMRGRLDDARSAGTEAATLFDELGDGWGRSRAADLLGHLDEIAGDYPTAARRHRDGLRHAERLRLWPSVIAHHNQLGRLALLEGDVARADDHHRRALALARDRGHGPSATFARLGLALAARRSGRLDEAAEHLAALRDGPGGADHVPETAILFAENGFLAEQRGDVERARREHRAGLEIARGVGDVRALALALEGLAGVAVRDGDAGRAAELLGAAEAARDGVGAPLPSAERGDVDRIGAAAVAVLGPDAFAAARDRGRADGVDAALRALPHR